MLLVGLTTLAILVAACGYAWWEVKRIAESNFNGKAFMLTASELQEFVEATGRWPESEEEFMRWEGGSLGWFDRQQEAGATIIVYDVDLAKEDLDSVETFRLLKPRNPKRFNRYWAYEEDIPELLKTLRAARDGELPQAIRVDQATPESKGDQVDLKKLTVDELVERLVSPFPMPDYAPMDPMYMDHPFYQQGRMEIIHPKGLAASDELVARGLEAVNALLKHRKDERYCWTAIGAAPIDLSVGRRVDEIIETILYPEVIVDYHGFKGQPNFGRYLHRVGVERYLEWTKRTPERVRELDYLRWYVREVEEYRKRASSLDLPEYGVRLDTHLVPFHERIAELEAAGVATTSPLD